MKKKTNPTPTRPAATEPQSAPPARFSDGLFSQKLLLGWLLALLAFALYANSIPNEYALDDGIVIGENKYTKKGLAGITDIMKTDAFEGALGDVSQVLPGGRYRPLSIVTFAIEHQFFGMNPHVSHAVNAILYGWLCFLVYFFCQRNLFPDKPMVSFLSAFLFTVHPIHTESVANIKGRDEIMSLIFLLLCLHYFFVYLKKLDEGNKNASRSLYAALWLFFVALLSKENGLAFVAIVPATVYAFTKRNLAQSFKTSLPLIAVVGVYFLLRVAILGFPKGETNADILNDPYVNATFEEKYATIIFVLGKYLRLLVFPHPLTYDYSFNQINLHHFTDGIFIFYALMNVTLLGWGLWLWWKKNRLGWAIVLYFLSLFLVSNIPINLGAPMGERLLFQPSLAFAICVAIGLAALFEKAPKGSEIPLAGAFSVLVLIPAGYQTVTRNAVWKNNETLFLNDVLVSPLSAKTQKACGEVLIKKARQMPDTSAERKRLLLEAVVYLKRSQEIHPKFIDAFLDCATAYFFLENYEESEVYWLKARSINPKHSMVKQYEGYLSDAFFVKGVRASAKVKEDPNQLGLSELYFHKSLNYNPANHQAWNGLGLLKFNEGNVDKALTFWTHAVTGDPNNVEYLNNLGGAYYTKGDFAGAAATWRKAYAINPNYRDLRNSLQAAEMQLKAQKK